MPSLIAGHISCGTVSLDSIRRLPLTVQRECAAVVQVLTSRKPHLRAVCSSVLRENKKRCRGGSRPRQHAPNRECPHPSTFGVMETNRPLGFSTRLHSSRKRT